VVSPPPSSDLPGFDADHVMESLFGLAPDGVCHAARCCHVRGALLPHRFTLAGRRFSPSTWAVCSLLHFPWTRIPQALPGVLSSGARTFLPHVPAFYCRTLRATAWPALRPPFYLLICRTTRELSINLARRDIKKSGDYAGEASRR